MIAAVTDEALDRVRARAPAGVELRGLGDRLDDVTFLVPGWEDELTRDPAELRRLRVVQVLSAGTDWIDDRVPPWATLCNARGARDVPVAEWVAGALLGARTGLLDAARSRTWVHAAPDELAGAEVVVLGHGSIGRAVSARLQPFGAVVRAVARTARPGVHGVDELPALLPAADALVILLPLTRQTRGLVDASLLARLRDGALVVNAGRGAVVDTDALVAELATARLRAVLDVVDPEPLPGDHPLWSARGLLALTAHQAGDSREADALAADLAAEQLRRFVSGEPLVNVVRPAAGALSDRPG